MIERRQSVTTDFGVRVAVLAAGHLTMMALMFALIETYEPEPNGFRFNSFATIGSFAAVTLGPVAIGLFVCQTQTSSRASCFASSS